MSRHSPQSSALPCTVHWVLFDFGGVLAEEGFLNGLKRLAGERALDPDEMAKAGVELVFKTGFTVGRAQEEAFWNALRQRTGLTGQDEDFREVILQEFRLRPWMLDLVRSLTNQGIGCAILSDQVDWLDRLNERFGFFRAFDRVFNSYHLGKSKRDETIFGDVAADLGSRPENILFIDDSPENVRRAESQGLKVIRYRNRQAFFNEFDHFCPDLLHERPQ